MNLADLLAGQAVVRPHELALLDATGWRVRRYTFAQLQAAVEQGATFFARAGVQPGDRVLVFHPMAADLYIALGALFRLGAAAVFVDPSLGREQIAAACTRWNPRALFASPRGHLLRLVVPAMQRIPAPIVTGWSPIASIGGAPGALAWRLDGLPRHATPVATTDATPALITTTSGSTGRPKVAVRSQGFLLAQHAAISATVALGPGDRVMTTLPIFVLSFLGMGAATILPRVDLRRPGRVRVEPLLRQIEADGVTCLAGSPAWLELLARRCYRMDHTLPSVTRIYAGGAPVFPDLLDDAQCMAPAAAVTAVYGATEAEPMAEIVRTAIRAEDRARMQTGGGLLVGPPIPVIRLRVLPDRWGTPLPPMTAAAFDAQMLPPGQTGEIVVCGPHVLPGYWQGEGDAETKIVVDGVRWHRTGDAGYLDAAGRLWLLGRCTARVADARGVLYPFAVECAAHTFGEVKHAAFIALEGQRVLVLELYQPLSPERRAALQQALAWAQVDRLQVLRRLPVDKRHNAKIDYPALRSLLARG